MVAIDAPNPRTTYGRDSLTWVKPVVLMLPDAVPTTSEPDSSNVIVTAAEALEEPSNRPDSTPKAAAVLRSILVLIIMLFFLTLKIKNFKTNEFDRR